MTTGRETRTIGSTLEYPILITPDGRHLISSSDAQSIIVWNLTSGELVRKLTGHLKSINLLAISPNGRYIVSGSFDKTIKVWNFATGEFIRSLAGHDGRFFSLVITPDSRYVIACLFRAIKIWELATGEPVRTIPTPNVDYSKCLAVTPDSRHVIACGEAEYGGDMDDGDGATVFVDAAFLTAWNIADGSMYRFFKPPHRGEINACAVTPDGRHVVSGSNDHIIRVWDFATGSLVRSFVGHSNAIHDLAITPDGRKLVSSSADRTIKVWDLPRPCIKNS